MKAIDWRYDRRGGMTYQHTQPILESTVAGLFYG
jgi:hypothetical protein